ncbi:PDR/VanB family oxidoreductase [Oceanibacterium hippocampi]|uniref:Phenoxybenzoate dioxygenase subunit beta n=1 Tax=Oceanibacterium hippocampi TaxID=745714 RepID=A0A1Y5TRI0_9PROT|nr:PDR/VanB family oxidoreductase [Oceanibacterium hippocampi]SLN66425.1 Phenoxybenzoate dioxygenase subunit beta [Oceanibacterium hippocampi]
MNAETFTEAAGSSRLSLRVADVRREAEDIVAIELVDPNGGALPTFEAGAHVDVFTPGGAVRQYSLFNDPADSSRYRIAVLWDRNGRGGSRSMHEAVRPGGILQVSRPRNQFRLAADAARHVLVAGGIGITPLLSMAEVLLRQGTDFALHYCTRSIERTAFLARIGEKDLRDHVHLHLDDGAPDQRLDFSALFEGESNEGAHLYYCGPSGFMAAVEAAAAAATWPAGRLHCEYFAVAPSARPADTAKGFVVTLAKSGIDVPVGPSETVVQALQGRGIFISTACEQGFCGTCITGVRAGLPDHRDTVLSDAEKARNDCFTPCCSRSLTDILVIDL